MAKLKGFGDWIEIFKGGKQIDKNGIERDGDWLIDRAMEAFNPSYHEPPLVIGHPKHDDPAYGWVKELQTKVVGGVKRLYARFRDVVPEFEQIVKDGRYKKRSAAFYSDGRLRHVGWLGAMPPGVKGLADVAFDEEGEEVIAFEFSEASP